MTNAAYLPSEAAQKASDYFNSLPQAERAKLAPLLEHSRQQGIAEALAYIQGVTRTLNARVAEIKTRDLPVMIDG